MDKWINSTNRNRIRCSDIRDYRCKQDAIFVTLRVDVAVVKTLFKRRHRWTTIKITAENNSQPNEIIITRAARFN